MKKWLQKYYVGILHFTILLLVSAIVVMGVQLSNYATNIPQKKKIIGITKVKKNNQPKPIARRYPQTKEQLQKKYIDKTIVVYSKKYGVEPVLIKAMIKVESNYNPKAVSSTGDMGLMQINKCHKLKKPFDINENVEFGTKMMAGLLKQNNNNVRKSLYCYNTGTNNVKKNRIPHSTKKYADKIIAMMEEN